MRYLIFAVLFSLSIQSYAMGRPKVNLEAAIDKAVTRYGLRLEPELQKMFETANVTYPPYDIALLAFKKERSLQLWARSTEYSAWKEVHTFPLTAFSGRLGPKLKERDLQIPEGVYKLTSFNPFSSMHLSMMINYPNNFDRLQAIKDGRSRLGGDIFLHGKDKSVGCLAVGDKAIDELFLLVRKVGLNHAQVIIAPNDLRKDKPATSSFAQPRWLPELYKDITKALNQYPLPQSVKATAAKPGTVKTLATKANPIKASVVP